MKINELRHLTGERVFMSMERNAVISAKADALLERLRKAPISELSSAKPIQEAWSESDIIHAIFGAANGDSAKVKDGLSVLSKGQLKKIYAKITGTEQISAEDINHDDKGAKPGEKDEPKKDAPKPKKDEPKKDEPKKDEPKKDEPKKDEPKKDEPKK